MELNGTFTVLNFYAEKFAELKKSITFAVAINAWEDRIVAIAADCKSAPSGSVVRVHLFPLYEKPQPKELGLFFVFVSVMYKKSIIFAQ